MDAIRLRQIDEVMGYDNHGEEEGSQTIREKPENDYAMIDAQKMMDVNDAAKLAATDARRQGR
jgi:hypothetical protein